MSLAVSSASIDESTIRLVVNHVDRLKSLRSRPIIVAGLPWQIEVSHRDHSAKIGGGENTLAIHLRSLHPIRINWSCAAMATVQLTTFNVDDRQAPLINTIGPWVFNARELCASRNSFIRWADLFDRNAGYIRGNQIRLVIRIAAQKLPMPTYLLCQHILNVHQISFRIGNVRDLLAADSSPFELSDLKWKVIVRKNRFQNDINSYLGILLYCIPSNDNTTYFWTRRIFAEFRLRSDHPNQLPTYCTQQFSEAKKFSSANRCHGISRFIKWNDLMDPQRGFVRNNHIVLEVNIRDESRERKDNNNNNNHPMAIIGNRSYPIVYQMSVFDHIDRQNMAAGIFNGTGDADNNNNATDDTPTINDSLATFSCTICLEPIAGREIMSTACGHVFCKSCISTSMKARMRCPNCQAHLDADKVHPLYLS